MVNRILSHGLCCFFLPVAVACSPPAPEAPGGAVATTSTGDAGATVDREPLEPEPVARTFTPQPLSKGDRGCASEKDCQSGEDCRSPEERSWNFCGAPMRESCPKGWTGDSCGHCFLRCKVDADCPMGSTCNDANCISPRRCAKPRMPPP